MYLLLEVLQYMGHRSPKRMEIDPTKKKKAANEYVLGPEHAYVQRVQRSTLTGISQYYGSLD
jgi:hypothetical protein